jgi:hypothetical protein
MQSRVERLARNEALFREVNESVRDVHAAWNAIAPGRQPLRIVCECSDQTCTETLDLTPERYAEVRTTPERFILLPGHEDLAIERLVETTEGYVVVEKTGEGAEVARKY